MHFSCYVTFVRSLVLSFHNWFLTLKVINSDRLDLLELASVVHVTYGIVYVLLRDHLYEVVITYHTVYIYLVFEKNCRSLNQ